MSRTELVKKILAEVLNQSGTSERASELDVQAKGEGNIQVYFCMAYWNDPIQVEVVNKLNAEGIALETWNVAGTHFGQVHVRLELVDPELMSSCKFPEVRKLAGCEDCPAWSGCPEEKVRY
jgi:hypothetical protein